MILVYVSPYVIFYDVGILQFLHILHSFRMFCGFPQLFSILLPWQPSNKQI